jgi:NitT/TauT family transport system substrate-binding protein
MHKQGPFSGRVVFLAALILLGGGSMLCAAGDKVVFRVAKRLSSAVAHIALAEGYFADEGLDIELFWSDSSGIVIPSLAQGKVDVSTTGQFDASFINVIERGARIRLVAARTVHATDGCGYFSFVARSELIDSGRLDEPAGLKGLRVVTERTAGSYYYWSQLLAKSQLTFDDVEPVNVPYAAVPTALAQGRVDLSSQAEPWPTRSAQTGKARIWKSVADVLPNHQSSYLVFGRRLLDERPDLGHRFMAAYMRAVQQYLAEGKSPRNIEIVASQTQMSREELHQMCWPHVVADGRIDPSSLQRYQEWALAEGMIDAIVPLEKLVDDRFLPPPNGTVNTGSKR